MKTETKNKNTSKQLDKKLFTLFNSVLINDEDEIGEYEILKEQHSRLKIV